MQPGTLLAQRYRIEAQLGQGGMGEVYLAEDARLGRKVALKILPPEFAADEDRLRRFAQEARAASALNHPNILTIYEVEQADGIRFIVTEFVEGVTLRDQLAAGPMDLRTLLEIGGQVAEALAAAHRAGIVHRDIKPENIMVRRDGYVKLLDFGLAKLTEPLSGEGALVAGRAVTLAGVLVGTMQYMSPEQAAGRSVDHRTDLFSLGCVLYEMATAEPAFAGESFIDVLQKITAQQPRAASEVNALVPTELEQIIEKCLAKDPAERYQHADELAADLRRVRRKSEPSGAVVAKPPRRPWRRRSIRTLAVLPLQNVSADPDTEYLSNGIAEVIISSLSQVPRLRVMAWSAVSGYKDQGIDPQKVGKALKVDAVLAGRIAQRDDTLVITAELVDAERGWQLWGGQYNRRLSDVFALQAEISSEISEKLRLQLTGAQKQRLARTQTMNGAAYQAYLKGRYYWNKQTEEGLRKGLEFFQQAVEQDPVYAQAYAGMADSYILLGEFGILEREEAFARARAAAQKALEIDAGIAEAHTSLGRIFEDEFDWAAAGREYRRAITLNPSYATGRHWYARFLTKIERFEQAIAEIRKAQELDPLSLVVSTVVGEVLFFARRYDEAMEEFRKTLEMDPAFSFGHLGVGLVSLQEGRYDEAIVALQKAVEFSQGSPPNVAHLGLAYARAGRRDEALRIVEELKDQPRRFFQIAEIYAALGENDRAFDFLDRAYGQRSVWMRYLKVDPALDSLRSDPRFYDLTARLRFPA